MSQVDDGAVCTASAEAGGLAPHFAELSGLIAPLFSRRDLRSNAAAYMRGLLCPGVAGNCWAIAQAAGHDRPYRLQHLLSGAVWEEDSVRDQVRGFVARHLGQGGVLIFDETGDLKKGTSTAGAGRQYTGTAGRIEKAIVAVYATYATPLGHGLVDRDLYVQKEWFTDRERMAKAGFPDDHAFATKPQLAKAQAERALDAGLAPAWGAGDEVYGRSSELRGLFEARGIGYVFSVGVDHQTTTSGHQKMRADQALTLVDPHGWNRRSAGAGSKGPRYYDWAWIATASPCHHLLIRRSISTGELAYYLAYVPEHYVCSLTDLVKVAGTRWAVEMVFSQLAKGPVRSVGGGWQYVADLGLAVGDDHAVDEQLGQLPPLGEGGAGQPGPHGPAEAVDPVGDGLEFEPLLGGVVQLPLLGEQGVVPAVQVLALALEFIEPDHLGQVGVQQPLPLAV